MNLGQLTTEARNPASEEIDRLSALEIVRLMNAEDARVPTAVAAVAGQVAQAIELVAGRLRRGGRLVYLGAGTSGRLGVLDASECPPTFNSPPWQVVGLIAGGTTALTRAVEGAEDHPELAVDDLQRIQLNAADVLVGIATSGRTPYVIGGLKYAREVGAAAIGLSCNADSELTTVSDLVIAPIVGPEVLSGSTRLKAGTATKLVLNMLTTGAMVLLGKTFGNLMVDLQATNQKLTDRSRRIVSLLTGIDAEAAASVLQRSQGDVKTAIVVQRRGVMPDVARALLQRAGGQLRCALELEVGDAETNRTNAATASLVIGVDGGGSKTTAWLSVSRDAEVFRSGGLESQGALRSEDSALRLTVEPIGIGDAGPSNPQAVGWSAALANIDCAIQGAFTVAGIERGTVASACLAISGVGRDNDQARLRQWAEQRRIAERLVITHDAMPILAAGTRNLTGIALISGTGSLAFGRNLSGNTARSGGWGFLFGDEGSGYELAREGLRAAVCASDGRGPRTQLLDAFLAALNIGTAAELVRAVYPRADDRQWIASLSHVVLAAADGGDAVAIELVDRAAERLAAMVNAVAAQLGEPVNDLALGGGLLTHAELLRARLLERLPPLEHVGLVPEPVAGAVILAHVAAKDATAQ